MSVAGLKEDMCVLGGGVPLPLLQKIVNVQLGPKSVNFTIMHHKCTHSFLEHLYLSTVQYPK